VKIRHPMGLRHPVAHTLSCIYNLRCEIYEICEAESRSVVAV